FLPEIHLDVGFVTMWVAVFGTTISPYLFLWQSAEEIEEHGLREVHGAKSPPPSERTTRDRLHAVKIDTLFGMTMSQVIQYAITLAAAAVLFPRGHRNPQTARE